MTHIWLVNILFLFDESITSAFRTIKSELRSTPRWRMNCPRLTSSSTISHHVMIYHENIHHFWDQWCHCVTPSPFVTKSLFRKEFQRFYNEPTGNLSSHRTSTPNRMAVEHCDGSGVCVNEHRNCRFCSLTNFTSKFIGCACNGRCHCSNDAFRRIDDASH